MYKKELSSLSIMRKGSQLLHELQIERGLSAGYLYEDANPELARMLLEQYKTTDKELLKVISYIQTTDETLLSDTNYKYLQALKNNISKLSTIREEVKTHTIQQKASFDYYSLTNKNIIALYKGLNLQTNSKKINADIQVLNILVSMQETAGQERALSLNLLNTKKISNTDKILYHKLIALQDDQYLQLNILLSELKQDTALKKIHTKYANNFFMHIRKRLMDTTLQSDTAMSEVKDLAQVRSQWIKVSTNRINAIHRIEGKIFSRIHQYIQKDIEANFNALMLQVSITILTIILLLLSTRYITKKIRYSIAQLELGLDDFFNFLNSKSEKSKDIQTNSDDEINDMAQRINAQRKRIEQHLEEDIDFIHEITHIVTLMKDGDFSERPYFEPYNPHLRELKDVFNQLTDLISQKIKEQTDSLEDLNNSLEERVHFQTLELEKQIQEITIAMEKAVQAEIAKDEFLANMSHEIRTPLNAILGFVTILKKITKEEKPLHYLNIIDTSGKSLLSIINDILDFSKIQSGKFTIAPHPVNLVESMSNASLLFASKAYEKYIVLAVYIDPHMPQKINIDSVRLIQIFSNLLSNAIKFTPNDGSIEVDVTCSDAVVTLRVKDTGIGIAEDNISKVFSAFEQADGSTTRKYGGTGLGLSISYKLAKLMGGDITLSSELGVGSTFTVTLPVEILDKKAEVFIEKEKIEDYTVAILDNAKKKK
ncbi:MAG: ATP-binding protein [Sulfurimonas sp.]|nr:ATP-binding protein [Sulfurimonas sp.]